METKELFGKTLPTDIQNPFLKECITYVSITARTHLFDENEWIFEGVVKFKQGNTSGEQRFKGDNLADVYMRVMNFCMAL